MRTIGNLMGFKTAITVYFQTVFYLQKYLECNNTASSGNTKC